MYDGTTKLYSTFTPIQTKSYSIGVNDSALTTGGYQLEIQTTCDDGATDVFSITSSVLNLQPGPDVHSVNLVAGTKYWFVLSKLDPGMKPTLTIN